MWVGGFWTLATVPSPKSHAQLVGVPVDVSVKVTAEGDRAASAGE